MMINALGPPVKQKYEPKLPRPVDITAGAAITEGGGGRAGRGGRGASAGRGGGGWRGGRSKWPDKVDPRGGNTGAALPEKKKYEKPHPSCLFCVAKKRPQTAHIIGACPWITAASKSDLITALPNLCLDCLKLKKVGEHKCPNWYKEGGQGRYFCSICQLNIKLCRSPTSHTPGFIPETASTV